MDELNFIFKMPDDETLAKYISIKGEKGEKGDPTKLSQLDNDTGFVTASTDALANYYTKSQTDTALNSKVDNSTLEAIAIPDSFFTGEETIGDSGTFIELDNTAQAMLKDIKLHGDTQQNGTPTPDDPIEVQTVTGDQTIIISGNDQQSQSYTLSLGDLELCKLGIYQDYIYKSGDKWYKHKAIDKAYFADMSFYWAQIGSTGHYRMWSQALREVIAPVANNDEAAVIMSNVYATKTANETYRLGKGISVNTNSYVIVYDPNYDTNSAVAFNADMEELGAAIYYALATPSEEEITNEILIRQLEDLDCSHSFNGATTIAVSGSLPAILSVDAFKKNWSGTISGINNELDNVYTKSETDNLLNDELRFIFPKFWANSRAGDCNLIKYHGKNILIDCHHEDLWPDVKAMLDDNEATHIDYFILTHYHTDHQGNIKNLVNNGYIDASTTIYMSAKVDNYGSLYSGNIAEYTGFLEEKGLAYSIPLEGEVLTIDDKLRLTFMNCDKDILDAYADTTNGNSCSTVTLIEFGNTKALYTGDADPVVFKRLYDLGFPSGRVDLYKVGHHGINTKNYEPFMYLVDPTFAVQTGGITDAVKNNFGICEETAILQKLGAKIYPVHMQTDYIEFVSDGSSINNIKGKTDVISVQWEDSTFYVDISTSTSAYQDGSQAHPFKELMQAISAIHAGAGMRATINVADGHYCLSHESDGTGKNRCYINSGRDSMITINGNSSDRTAVTINGIFVNGSNVTLNNLTLDLKQNNALFARSSDVILDNVLMTASDELLSTKSGIVAHENSRVIARNVRIEYANEAIIAQESTVINGGRIEIGPYQTAAISEGYGGIVLTKNNTIFDSDADKLAFTGWRKAPYSPVQIMQTHESNATTINLAKSLNSFDWIEIFYAGNYNLHGSTGRIYSPHGKSTFLTFKQTGSGGNVENGQARAILSGTTITIDRVSLIAIDGNGVTLTHPSNPFNILKVEAGYNDFVDLNS